jgi:Mg2+ and Co2+ transporter CorA
MINIIFFNIADKSIKEVSSINDIPSLLAEKEGFYWLDFLNNESQNFQSILDQLAIDFHIPKEFDRPEILSQISDSPNLLAFNLYDIEGSETMLYSLKDFIEIKPAPILVLLGIRFVITYRLQPLDLIDYVQRDCAENFKISGKTPAFIIFLLVQHCLYHFARINLANDNYLDAIIKGLYQKKITESMNKISIAGFNILTINKLIINLAIILLILVTKNSRVVSSESKVYFSQMLDVIQQVRNTVDTSRHSLDSIVARIDAENTKKTEEVVRVLTIFSVMCLPFTVIAGIYGMNFQGMPELHWANGYYYALGLMLFISFSCLSIFYYFGWLAKSRD